MSTFTGRLFGPGLAGTGEPVTAHWLHDTLVCQTSTRSISATAPLRLREGGFNATQLNLTWSDADGDFVFGVDDGAARATFLAGLPAALQAELAQAQRGQSRVQRRFRWALVVVALVLAVPLVALTALVVRSDAVIAWLVDWVPPAQEAKLGDLVLAQTRAEMKVIETGPAVDAIRSLGEKLTPNTAYTYRWLVVDRPDTNALAAPGGVVLVFSGLLLAADTPEELAGVLAHEVAHAELRHGLQGVVKSAGVQAGAWLLGDVGGAVMSGVLADLLDMKFSRSAEEQADQEGLRRLAAARINPAGMVTFMDKLAKKDGGAKLPAWLSTHPASAERAAQLRLAAADLKGPWQAIGLDWAAVRQSVLRR
ncbi:MAG: hypothetical protein CFE43_07335 [Burkholderiales bacterium PBB3]|nr:MAG: hypothetical protein CFE43_07335 [Burkholderiales bacterium PBB3]